MSHRPKKHLQLVFARSRASEEPIGESQQEPSSVDEVGKSLRQQRVEVGGGVAAKITGKKTLSDYSSTSKDVMDDGRMCLW